MKSINFITSTEPQKYSRLINPTDELLFLGSCFAENIGQKMRQYGFHSVINPCGIHYNTASQAALVRKAIQGEKISAGELQRRDDVYFHWLFPTLFSATSKASALAKMNAALIELRESITSADWLVISLGTAWVYKCLETQSIVANCHKMPSASFVKELYSSAGIKADLDAIWHQVRVINPSLRFLLTVSPVRHKKDGLIQNNRSKSRLIEATHDFIGDYPDVCDYFPAYEYLIDELRDYRWYAPDMVHPSDQAIDFIWRKLIDQLIADQEYIAQMTSVLQKIGHRSLIPEAQKAQDFRQKRSRDIEKIQKDYPHLEKSVTFQNLIRNMRE